MRDPILAPDLFARDRVCSREILLESRDFGCLPGATLERESVGFSASPRLTLSLHSPEQDLSRFNQLSLRVKNRAPDTLLVGMRLVRASADESGAPGVSFTGGREELIAGQWMSLRFPMECFGTYGASTERTDIRYIEFSFGYDRTHTGPTLIKVSIASLAGESRDIPPGPRLTRKGLAEVSKPDSPFAATSLHAPRADTACSCREGSEDTPIQAASGLYVPPPHPYPRETAEEMLAGRIMGQELQEPIPWNANPLGIQEWTHFLNRHHFLRALVIALTETQDQRYTAALDRHIRSWIVDNPVPVDSNGGAGPAWETLSAAWRLREWTWVRRIAWQFGAFSQDARASMLRAVWEHACHLMDHHGHPNNWIIVESCALALAGIWFPEFRDADLWVRSGVERLRSECKRQFFADGTHFEISPLYHAICTHAMLEVKHAAAETDLTLPEEFDEPLERCFTYLAAQCRPDFTWPSLNDSGSADSDYTALMRMAGEIFHRPDLLWIGTHGRRGAAPARTCHAFPDAGIATMRSSYASDAHFLVFRAGPPGAAHLHDDALGLDVTAWGVPRLVDPGITTYAPDVLSEYYRAARAHNTLLIDDCGPNRAGMPFLQRIAPAGDLFSWRSTDSFHAVFGLYRGPWTGDLESVAAHRSVIFVGSEYWIVRDAVCGANAHEISTCWQFSPARVVLDPRTLLARVADARGPQFALIPVTGENTWEIDVRTGSLAPETGWTSLGGRDVPSCSLQYRAVCRLPFVQEWILFPFRGRPFPGVKVTRSHGQDRATVLEISFPDHRMDVVCIGPLPEALGDEMYRPTIEVTRHAGMQ